MATLLLLAAAIAAVPAAGSAIAAPQSAVVEIHEMRFNPLTLTIAAGATVTWVNDDPVPHTVTDKGRLFRSAALDTKERFSYTFKTPGEFTYFCTIHPMMVGRIIVK